MLKVQHDWIAGYKKGRPCSGLACQNNNCWYALKLSRVDCILFDVAFVLLCRNHEFYCYLKRRQSFMCVALEILKLSFLYFAVCGRYSWVFLSKSISRYSYHSLMKLLSQIYLLILFVIYFLSKIDSALVVIMAANFTKMQHIFRV